MNTTSSRHWKEIKAIASDPWLLGGLVVSGAFLALFIVYPLARACVQSVLTTDGSFDLTTFHRLLFSPQYRLIIYNTLQMGVLAALVSTIIGFVLAYTLARCHVPFEGVYRAIATLPIVSPPFAVAMSIVLLFGRVGLVTWRLLGVRYDIYGLDGLMLAQVITFFPVAFLMFEGLFQALDPSMEEAAQSLGASKRHIFLTVTLPLMIPGIAGALLLLFVTSLSDLSNPAVMGGSYKVLATEAYYAIIGRYDVQEGSALSVLLLIPSVTAFMLQRYWVSRKSYISVTGKPASRRIEIKEWYIRYPLIALASLLVLFVAIVYGLIFVGAFSNLWGVDYSFTLRHFVDPLWGALNRGRRALVDTLTLSAYATPLAGLIGIVIAFLVVRKKFIGKQLLDFVSIMGMAVPGTIVGIGFILAFNRPPLVLTGTGLIIVLVFAVRSLPAAVRSGTAALLQIDPSIEEASTSLGADAQYTFRHVTIPLVRPALLASLIYSFTHHMTTLSAVVFVVSAQYKLLTAQVLNQIDLGNWSLAAAFCSVLIVIVMASVALLRVAVGYSGQTERGVIL